MTAWTSAQYLRDAEPNRCRRLVEFIRQAGADSADAAGLAAIDMTGTRPCGGRLNDGKCEFCDVTTIEAI